MKKIYLLILAAALVLLSGCETMRGMGRDIENTGDNIQDLIQGKTD